jgi:geranylgeranyl diphosphate synthase type I
VTTSSAEILGLEGFRDRVDAELARFLHARIERHPDLGLLLQPVAELVLGGGKRVRPALCYWAWRAAGGPDCDGIVSASAALELLHTCALIHDDVMDQSDLRRFRPTVHRRLSALHADRGWQGSADDFGVAAAIAAGDLCLVWADELVRASHLPEEARQRGWPVYDAMRAETIRGQYLDLVTQVDGSHSPEDAWRVAEAKTAASTTSGPLLFGAALAGAQEQLKAALAGYGRALGVAFQLHDDLLGAFGDPLVTGKPSGDDLRDGKATLLLAEARHRAGPAGAQVIDELLARGDEEAVGQLRLMLIGNGARSDIERLIERLTAEALAALESFPIADESARKVLHGLALTLTRGEEQT